MRKKQIVLAIHEASGQDITFQNDVAYSLVSGGGKPGQGYPCVLIIYENLTEKRFFEWHEDDVSVTLRNKGGSYGEGQKC